MTDDNTAKFKFEKQEYEAFSPQPTIGDKLDNLEDLTENKLEKIVTGHSELFWIVMGVIGFLCLLLVIFALSKSLPYITKAYLNYKMSKPNSVKKTLQPV